MVVSGRNALFLELERLRLGAGEYCSHDTALHLLGFLPAPPARLTIVTPSRRRSRRIGGRDLVFVHLPADRLEPVQILEREGRRLAVSTLEKTLVDLLAYLELAPCPEDLVVRFATLPYAPLILLRLARGTSDSVLKRAAWLMAFTGRLSDDQIPWADLTATPVRLDPREVEGKNVWDGRFHLKVPSRLLRMNLPAGIPEDSPVAAEWLELRRFPAFVERIVADGHCPVRGDPAPRARRMLDDWARGWAETLSVPKLDAFLAGHADALRTPMAEVVASSGFPCWLNRWLEGRMHPRRPNRLVPRRTAIKRWVRGNVAAADLGRAESALHLGHRLGLEGPVLAALESRAYALLDAGREATIRTIADHHLGRGRRLPPRVCVATARSMVRSGAPEEALALLRDHLRTLRSGADLHAVRPPLRGCSSGRGTPRRPRGPFWRRPTRNPPCLPSMARAAGGLPDLDACGVPPPPPEVLLAEGEFRYAIGGIQRRLGRFEDALAEFEGARRCFTEVADGRGLMMVESALGNLHLWRGNHGRARVHLRAALAAVPARKGRESRAVLLGSLAQIEYERGRYRTCIALLTRAQKIRGPRDTGWGAANLLVARAKACLELGQVARAMGDLQAARRFSGAASHPGFACGVSALLAWCCQLLGQDAAARSWWNAVGEAEALERETRGQFAVRMLRAMSLRFAGQHAEAARRYRELLPLGVQLGLSATDLAGVWLGIGICERLVGMPSAAESLRQAWDGLKRAPGRSEARQARIFLAALAPEILVHDPVDLRAEVAAELAGGAFDPFWAWYSPPLLRLEDPAARAYVRSHLQRTPSAMRKSLAAVVPGFSAWLAEEWRNQSGDLDGFTKIGPTGVRQLSGQEYRRWQKRIGKGVLRFDGPAGRLSLGSRACRLKPGSLLHRILANLLAAFPRPVRVEQLYSSVWGSAFDPEFDPPSVKTALFRLRQTVGEVLPGLTIRQVTSENKWGALRLELPLRWEAVL